ncbi:MAG: MFS transporter [Candidatus Accumulibacter sp.]|jgi:MFS family permease|nr:MFS transporter [Accumulibacter sp.]
MPRLPKLPQAWIVTLSAAGILLITMGARQSLGLFVMPLNAGLGVDIASISLALAIGQFVWGAVQPLAGALADRFGPARILYGGICLMALGSAITPWLGGVSGLIASLGLLSAAGSGASSFSVLFGAAANRLPMAARGTASGVINAGGSFGQFIFAPILQKLIQAVGWIGGMMSLALMVLLALPLVRNVASGAAVRARPDAGGGESGPWRSIVEAMKNRDYLLLHAGFFTCGFHVAFLVTHLPGEIGLCHLPPSVAGWSLAIIGLTNVFGSLMAGACVARYRGKHILFWMYGSRALMIAIFLAAPRTDLNFYLFAVGLGFTWLATVPPTAAIVGKLFGVRYLGTLFGLTLLSHQTGGFLGAWLGGLSIARFGDLSWMWYADMALAGFAALVNLPIREAPVVPSARQTV